MDAFLLGLADYIKDELVSYDLPASLDEIIALPSCVDRRIQARHNERWQGQGERLQAPRLPALSRSLTPPASTPRRDSEPMQIGRASLTPQERERRRRGNLCLYCGQPGHFLSRCPEKGSGSPVTEEVLVSHISRPSSVSRSLCQVRLLLPQGSQTLATLIDSGSDAKIIDNNLARQLGVSRIRLPVPVSTNALDGRLLGTVIHQTVPIHMLLSGNHHETIQFHILSSPHHPLLLGFPWLRRHNPHIDWTTGAILGWSPTSVIRSVLSKLPLPSNLPVPVLLQMCRGPPLNT